MKQKTGISEEERALFRESIGKVKRLRHDRAVPSPCGRPLAVTDNRQEDRVPDGFSDAGGGPLLEAHDTLWFARPGLQRQVLRRLRRGQIRAESELDLHGMTVAMARPALAAFLHHSLQAGRRCVRVIHGKGFGHERKPVLKNRVNHWLRQQDEVLAFCSARPADGGSGAVNVLLKKAG